LTAGTPKKTAGQTMTNGEQLTKDIIGVNREDAPLDLARIREAKGLTLHDINTATKITLASLEAIERGDFRRLPEPVYARNFIKSYAASVGIDALPILRRYADYLQAVNKPLEASTAAVPGRKTKAATKDAAVRAIGPRVRNAALFLIGLIVTGIAVYFLSVQDDRALPPVQDKDRSVSADHRQPVQPAVVTPPGGPSAASPTAPQVAGTATVAGQQTPPGAAPAGMPGQQAGAAAGAMSAGQSAATQYAVAPAPARTTPGTATEITAVPQRLHITATERTWLRITADGGRAEELMLKKGEAVERTARDSFLITIGNAGGVQVRLQGKPLPELGKRGEVRHLKLP